MGGVLVDGVLVQQMGGIYTDGLRGLFDSCLNYAPLNYSCKALHERPLLAPKLVFCFSLFYATNLHDDIYSSIMPGWHSDRFLFAFCWRAFGCLVSSLRDIFILFSVSRGDAGFRERRM